MKPGYLFVLPWGLHHVGGVNQVVTNLFTEIAQADQYVPYLLVLNRDDTRIREQQKDGRREVYFRIHSPWNERHPIRALVRFLVGLPQQVLELKRWLSAHDVQVINVHYPTAVVFLCALLKWMGLYKGKIVLSLHGADLRYIAGTTGVTRWCMRKIFKFADATVTCSKSLAEQAREELPDLVGHIHVVHNGLDIQRLVGEQSNSFAIPPQLRGRRFILNVARFEHKKGQDVLIRAFHSLSMRYPWMDLVIIGANGPEREAIVNLIGRLRLESRVALFQDVPHSCICAFLEAAFLFVLPSRQEPFGIVLLEAAAMHIPVIATRVGGIPEIVVDGESGLLVRPDDTAALTERIAFLVENDEMRKVLAHNLYLAVRERFTWKRAYEQYMQIVGAGAE